MEKNTANCKVKTLNSSGLRCYNPAMTIAKVKTVYELRAQVKTWRQAGLSVGLVPTMGALHAGHLSLVEQISKHVDRIIVSIFVNPAQFGEAEDFEAYPRVEAADIKKLGATKTHLVYLPRLGEMYPEGAATVVSVPALSSVLCGKFRPGHFDGVATIVTKLLLQALPDAAIFGEKDYQQLQVIQRASRDLDLPVTILAAPTVRETDGLAMSSRNAYLSNGERKIAGALPATLNTLKRKALAGQDLRQLEMEGEAALHLGGFTKVDYIEFREADDLSQSRKVSAKTRLFAAARLGTTRLIDNMAVK